VTQHQKMERKNHYYPMFLDEFSQGGDQKNISTYAKALLVRK
jgi:hypothetical protein